MQKVKEMFLNRFDDISTDELRVFDNRNLFFKLETVLSEGFPFTDANGALLVHTDIVPFIVKDNE